MADDVRITSMPDNSTQGVALELWKALRFSYQIQGGVDGELRLYKACKDAVLGRAYDVSSLT